jgi:uncharacterized protein YndB with AHSA1/START domain
MTESGEFTLTRVVRATRETVWHVLTHPAELSRWLHPGGMSTPADSVEVDLRQGGAYRYTMVDDGTGARHTRGGVYLEVRPPERLAFTWGVPGDEAADPAVVTVTLFELDGETEITLDVRGVTGCPGDGGVYDGWSEALDALEGVMGGAHA